MNYADARRVTTRLEALGYEATPRIDEADVILLETCTVRQQSEDKAYNKLYNIGPLKKKNPDLTVAVMGCVVGVRGNDVLEKTFPFVDVFMEPATSGDPLVSHLTQNEDLMLELAATKRQHDLMDGEVILPLHQQNNVVSSPVSIVEGCSHACSFCIIPQKRGIERSRPVGSIVSEVRSLVRQGVKEVVLLGQIVDRYGYDVPDGPDLADLLKAVNSVDGLERIRFLTSHPNYMSDKILEAVRDLPKVMPVIEVPVQAGNNEVLVNMKRGYTQEAYRALVQRIRATIPEVSIHCDIIVGFPGESAEQFQETADLLSELKLDKIHLARYSPRPGTVSARRMEDDVSEDEKRRRYQVVEQIQANVSKEKMARWFGETVEVLVEGKRDDRWYGRTPQGRLVFFPDERELKGEMVKVEINHAGVWSMSGLAVDRPVHSIPLTLI